MDLPEALSVAASQHRGVLVTTKRDGRPQLSNIAYDLTDGRVRISVTADRAKYANAVRDPRVSLYVGREDFGAYLVLEGDAEVTPPAEATDDDTVDALIDLYRDLAGEHPDWDDYRRAMVADRRAVLSFVPTNAYGMWA
jgi:PPOX class probable F420-dependent enzyme